MSTPMYEWDCPNCGERIASAVLPPKRESPLDTRRLRTVLIDHGFAYQNWQNGDIDLPVEEVEKIVAEYARLVSDSGHPQVPDEGP